MRTNDIKELHTRSVDELKKSARDIRAELTTLQIDYAIGKEKNTAKRKELGRDLARIMTVLGNAERSVVQSAPVVEKAEVKEKKTKSKKEEKEEAK